jgi:AhpC/TSA family
MLRVLWSALLLVLICAAVEAADQGRRVVIYDGVATEVAASAEATADLCVTMADLKRATRFEVKPQGVCRDTLCFPLPKSRKAEFILKKGAVSWFNLSAFARLIKQPAAFEQTRGVWYFGPRLQAAEASLSSGEAPDFTLPDMSGKPHSLTDFRGKKVLLLTWASW